MKGEGVDRRELLKRRPTRAEEVLNQRVDELFSDVRGFVEDNVDAMEASDGFRSVRRSALGVAKEVQRRVRRGLQRLFDDVFDAHVEEIGLSTRQVEQVNLERVRSRLKQELLSSGELRDALQGVRTSLLEDVDSVFSRQMTTGNIDTEVLVETVREQTDDLVGRVRTIVRTELHKVSQSARAAAFDEVESEFGAEFRYDWKGPSDDRTTDLCESIKRRVAEEGGGDGVSKQRLREIMVEEIQDSKFGGEGFEPWTPHFNCRHQLVRMV